MRSVHAKKEAVSLDFRRKEGSLCQRYVHKSLTNILISKEGAFDKEISSWSAFADKQESNVEFQSPQYFESSSFFGRAYFLSFPFPHEQKRSTWWSSSFLIYQWQEWHSQRWQEKRQRQNHAQTSPGNWSTREKNSVSVKIMWILTPFAVLRISQILRSVFESFASIQLSWTRRSMYRQLFIVRALFPSRTSHVITLILCVCLEILSHYLTCLCWTFL